MVPQPIGRPSLRNDAVLEFLRTRRSVSAKTLTGPGPDRAEIEEILRLGARSPDHGMLVPWRFVVLTGAARERIERVAREVALDTGLGEEIAGKAQRSAAIGPVVIAVICQPAPSAKIPAWEQELSAGAVCLGLVNAGLAAGWGANWITGPLARNPAFLERAFGTGDGSFVAGFIHLGTPTIPVQDRDRPDLAAITEWPDA